MKFSDRNLLLYAVTDSRWCTDETLPQKVEKALKGGITLLQIREKNLDDESFLKLAMEIKTLTDRYCVPLLINDNIEVALKSGADGVHVGQNDMKPEQVRKILGEDAIIGVTAKTPAQAMAAERAGADYIGTGAFFGTGTKTDAASIDWETAEKTIASVNIPAVAIGGITMENMHLLKGTGAKGAAVVSSIFKSSDIINDTKRLREIAEKTFEVE